MTLTPSELVVLGLLVEKPRHGYELEQTIEQRGIRQWAPLAFSSIYYVLTKLEKRGLVAAHSSSSARTRRVFTATDAGRAEASAAVIRVIAHPASLASPLAVGLANAPLADAEDFAGAIRTRMAALDAQRRAVEAAWSAQHPVPEPAEWVFSYSLAMLIAEHDWLAARLEDMR